VEWSKGQQIVLEANRDYWGPAPTVDRLVFKGIPDATTRRQALEAGEVDIIEDVALEDVSSLRDKGFVIADTPIAQSVLLSPYMIDAVADGHPTANPKVRLAMNHAVNRKEIIDTVLGGFAKPLGGQVTGDDAFGWNPSLSDFAYDPALARQLLADAGFPDGVDLGTLFIGEPGEFFKQADFSEVVRAQLAEVGIGLTPEVVEFSTFLRMALQEYSLKYWHVGGWQYYPVMDSAFALMWYDSDAFLRQGLPEDSGYNEVWRASNREFDVEKRRGLLEESQRIIHDTPGPVVLWQHHKIYAHTDRVKGLNPTPDERIHWNSLTV
jgi:peptide/nickel transport system substrate-binding protein